MKELSPQQKKQLEKLGRVAKVLDGGDLELIKQLTDFEDKVEAELNGVKAEVAGALSVAERTKKLRGEEGPRGPRGEKGERGERGRDGKDSKVPGPKGDKGDTVVGPMGPPGRDGVDGKDGEMGMVDVATLAYLEDEIKRVEKAIPEVVKQRETNFGFVIRDVTAGSGVTIDKTDPNRPIITASGGADWTYYATTWTVEPTLNTTIAGGDVYNYTLDGTTRYRFVPTTYDATEDAFYSTFSDPTLSGLIVARG